MLNKVHNILIIVGMVALSTMPTWANKNDNVHGVAVWGGAGYSAVVNNSQQAKLLGGGGGLLGAGYQFQNKRFILNVGPEFRIFSSTDKMVSLENPYIAQIPGYVNDGTGWVGSPWTKNYYFVNNKDGLNLADQSSDELNKMLNFKETQVVAQLMLPVLAGMEFEKWYWMAGAKVGYTLFGSFKQKSGLETTAFDPLATATEYADLQTHNLVAGKYENKGKSHFGLDVTLSAEAGVNLDQWMPETAIHIGDKKTDIPQLHYRLGAFIDYGLPILSHSIDQSSMPKDVAGNMIWVDANDAHSVSLHNSNYASKHLNSLLVGVKMTLFFQLNKPKLPKQQNPRMIAYVLDDRTDKPLGNTTVAIYNHKTKRTANKKTNAQGRMLQRYPAGDYTLRASRTDYLPNEITVTHEGDATDTLQIRLTPVPVLRVIVKDAKTDEGILANAKFVERETGNTMQNNMVDAQNGLTVKLKLGVNYNVELSSLGYRTQTIEIDTIEGTIVAKLNKSQRGKRIKIENLFFASNETVILPESEEAMQQLFNFLNEDDEIRIRIIGHTDSIGTDEDNQILSEGRANSVRQSMIDRGIDPSRIEAEGHGETEPVATNETEEGRQLNRRVEFVIL